MCFAPINLTHRRQSNDDFIKNSKQEGKEDWEIKAMGDNQQIYYNKQNKTLTTFSEEIILQKW